MSAKDHLQQLQLFYTPKEFDAQFEAGTGDLADHDSAKEMWDYKLYESQAPGSSEHAHNSWSKIDDGIADEGPSLYDSIAKGGVQDPVQVWHGDEGAQVWDGHHRVAVARDLNKFIPVKHRAGDEEYWG